MSNSVACVHPAAAIKGGDVADRPLPVVNKQVWVYQRGLNFFASWCLVCWFLEVMVSIVLVYNGALKALRTMQDPCWKQWSRITGSSPSPCRNWSGLTGDASVPTDADAESLVALHSKKWGVFIKENTISISVVANLVILIDRFSLKRTSNFLIGRNETGSNDFSLDKSCRLESSGSGWPSLSENFGSC